MSEFHTPVLLPEVIEGLGVTAGKSYIDATLGGGGHALEIVKRGGIVLGIDTDGQALKEVQRRIKEEGIQELSVAQGNFRDVKEIAEKEGFDAVDGILFDLGVSSHQLNTPQRGFSYRFTGAPLDLRLDQSQGETAAQLVNRLSEDALYEIIAQFGEEELARSIAHGIGRARAVKKIATVGDLIAVIEKVEGARTYPVLSRVFQALRIAVNDELGSLKKGLGEAREVLRGGGRLVVISFHSLEDRIVKQYMRQKGWRLIATKPITARDEEVARNPRARSAKMRVAEKIV
jgi:16S rRNA (cytosine1402-N4)-methyltransferase